MTSYRELYFYLFAAMADAVEDLERGEAILGIRRLTTALQEAEDRATEMDIVPEVCDDSMEGGPDRTWTPSGPPAGKNHGLP